MKEGVFVMGFNDLEECHCDCHKGFTTIFHDPHPCCVECPNCDKRIIWSDYHSGHEDRCKFNCICECHTKDGGKPQENCNGYKCDCGRDNILSLEEAIQRGLMEKEDQNDQ